MSYDLGVFVFAIKAVEQELLVNWREYKAGLLRVFQVNKGITLTTRVYESASIFLIRALDRRDFDNWRRCSGEFLLNWHPVNRQVRDTDRFSRRGIRSSSQGA